MTDSKKRLLTGLQPSGTLHIGNYFGSLKPFLDTYKDYESFLMVADLHALTTLKDASTLRKNTYNIVKDYLAIGVDPQKVTLFKQSDNQDHTELAWILNCQVTVPFLMQAHSYKDKIAKGLEPNVGLFTYPMLMAADILLYDTDVVPVGEDQRQHVEYARDAATKFNLAFNTDLLKAPQELIFKNVGVVPGIDGQKMSKSYKNTIPLFGSREDIQKSVMSIVTDSDGDIPKNVYEIHKLFRSEAELNVLYQEHKGKYGELKKMLATDIDQFISPMRERRQLISDEMVKTVLQEGAERARATSATVMNDVRTAVGIAL